MSQVLDPDQDLERAARPVTRIAPALGTRALDVRELFRFRELLWILIQRDVRVRYKQAVIGVGWALFQPLLQAAIFTAIFGLLVRVPTGDTPYAVFVLCGILPWQVTAKCVTEGGTSLAANQALLTKAYFPRLFMPMIPASTGLVDFVCAIPALLLVMGIYGVTPGWGMALAPLFVLMSVAAGFAFSVWFAALDVAYRDVRFVLPLFTMTWMYASPVIYPATLVPERWQLLYSLNPMAPAIQGFRWSMLGTTPPPEPLSVGLAVLSILLILSIGLVQFSRMDRVFADRV